MKKRNLVILSCLLFIFIFSGCHSREEMIGTEATESEIKTAAIENLTFDSTYEQMSVFGEPNVVTPIDEESIVINKGHYVTAEYGGLEVTLSATEDFGLTESSSVYAVTVLSETYTDSNGLKVGTSKEELMQKFSLTEDEFLSGEENEAEYRLKNNFIAHQIPKYDSFYPAENGESPVILIYLIKDDCVNGILLRHLTAD